MKVLRHMLAPGIFALLATGNALAEDEEQIVPCKDIPAAVMTAFAEAYPKATIKSCAKEEEDGKTSYEVASVENDVGRDVLYDPQGKVIVVEETLALSGVPESVRRAVDTKFPKGEILLVEKLMRGSSVNYEFQIKDKGETKEIVFDAAGNEIEP
jgi:Putative beta-lactamase-inhibitor-like, PepSY-like